MKSGVENSRIMDRVRRFWRGNNRGRLFLTLEVAVMLPAAALIYINFHQLKSLERDKKLEAAIHGDFHYMLAISEKQINQKAYKMTEEARAFFPSPDVDSQSDRVRKLDAILSTRPWLAHVYLFDAEQGLLFRSQPQRMSDPHFREEHQRIAKMLGGYFAYEGKELLEQIHKRARGITLVPRALKERRRVCLQDECPFLVAAAPEGPGCVRGAQLRPRLPEADLLSQHARRAHRPQAG